MTSVDPTSQLHPTSDTVLEPMSDQRVEDTTATYIALKCSHSHLSVPERMEDERSDEICSDAGTLSVTTFFNGETLLDQNLTSEHFNYPLPLAGTLGVGLGFPATPVGLGENSIPRHPRVGSEHLETLSDHMLGRYAEDAARSEDPQRRCSENKNSKTTDSQPELYVHDRESTSAGQQSVPRDEGLHYAPFPRSVNIVDPHRRPFDTTALGSQQHQSMNWESSADHSSGRARSMGRWNPTNSGASRSPFDYPGARPERRASPEAHWYKSDDANSVQSPPGIPPFRQRLPYRTGNYHHDRGQGRRRGHSSFRRPNSRNHDPMTSSRPDVPPRNRYNSGYETRWQDAKNELKGSGCEYNRTRYSGHHSRGPSARRGPVWHGNRHVGNRDYRPPDQHHYVGEGDKFGYDQREGQRPARFDSDGRQCRQRQHNFDGHTNVHHITNNHNGSSHRRPRQGNHWGRGGREGGRGKYGSRSSHPVWRDSARDEDHLGRAYNRNDDGDQDRDDYDAVGERDKVTLSPSIDHRDVVSSAGRRHCDHPNANRRNEYRPTGSGGARRASRGARGDYYPSAPPVHQFSSLDRTQCQDLHPTPLHLYANDQVLQVGQDLNVQLTDHLYPGELPTQAPSQQAHHLTQQQQYRDDSTPSRRVVQGSFSSARRTLSQAEGAVPAGSVASGDQRRDDWNEKSSTTVTSGTLHRWPSSG